LKRFLTRGEVLSNFFTNVSLRGGGDASWTLAEDATVLHKNEEVQPGRATATAGET
jgi:hypothetical protein